TGEYPLCDVLIADGKIASAGRNPAYGDAPAIDCTGLTLMPSFIDLHAHFRDPGLAHKEDIATGCRAAVHGGYTAVNLMANTKPICSDMQTVRYVQDKAKETGICDVFQTVSITKDFDGETLSHIDALDGVKWLSDDGFGIQSSEVMLRAMRKAHERNTGLMLHEDDSAIFPIDSYFGEELPTLRDVRLAQITGCKTHFCHVSTRNAMQYIIDGKIRGANITCEVTPHHLLLNDTNPARVNPPLRAEEHRQALIEAIKTGHVDAIATDHAPHTAEDKALGAPGFTMLDLAFPACYTALVKPGHISLPALSRLMSASPAKLMGLPQVTITQGSPADLVILDLEHVFTADESHIHSKSKNSPMLGMTLHGLVVMTIKEGKIVYEAD
ncbi:MAG: dihydroorotase, partial [Oscillospiraceae bacterium]|nr:dihydroorotase [Oscillospiraceae bacterium]